MATRTKAPKVAAPTVTDLVNAAEVLMTVDADGYAIIDPTATKLDFDPKVKRPWKLHCVSCQKPIRRADNAPGHTCAACDTAALKAAKAPKAAVAVVAVATAPAPAKAPRSKSQNPRVLANAMVTKLAIDIAARTDATATRNSQSPTVKRTASQIESMAKAGVADAVDGCKGVAVGSKCQHGAIDFVTWSNA